MDEQTKTRVWELMEKAKDGNRLVALAAAIIQVFFRAGLAWFDDVSVVATSFHWLNRDELGLILEDMVELLSEVFSVGYVAELVSPVLIQAPEVSKWFPAVSALVKNSKGRLADVKPDDIKFLTLRGTHIMNALRCVALGARSDDKSMCVDGRISLGLVKALDINMFQAATTTVKCTVLHKSVHEIFGDELMQIIQATISVSVI